MPIVKAEIKYYKSLTVSDLSGNGGRMSANQIVSGAASNLFSVAGVSERTSGSTKYRKVFAKVANDADLPLFNPMVYLDKNTPGDDRVTFFPATQTDTQAAVTGSERQYGAGALDANVIAGATAIDVAVELGSVVLFVDGDTIRISDKPDVDSAGNEEFVAISGVPSVVGDVVSINLATPLANGYSASNTRVASVYSPPADVEPTVDNLVVTSVGDGDLALENILGDSIGSIEQTWTLTFSSATVFNIVGDTVGAQGTGSIGSGASPNNASFTKPYFVIQSAGFSGTFQAGDTIVFQTHPAAVALWLKRVIPAAAAVQGANQATIVLDGETS